MGRKEGSYLHISTSVQQLENPPFPSQSLFFPLRPLPEVKSERVNKMVISKLYPRMLQYLASMSIEQYCPQKQLGFSFTFKCCISFLNVSSPQHGNMTIHHKKFCTGEPIWQVTEQVTKCIMKIHEWQTNVLRLATWTPTDRKHEANLSNVACWV